MAKGPTIPTTFTAVDKVSKTMGKMQRSTSRFADRAKRSFARVQRSARRFRSTVKSVNSSLFNMRTAAGALAAGGALRGLKRLTDSTAEYTDELAKNARFLDMEVSQLQGYRFAAERAGVESSKMDKAFESLGKRVGELQQGTGSLFSFLDKRGDQALIRQLENVENTDEAMKLLSDKYATIEGQTNKAAFASRIFSKTNMEVTKVMEGGSEELQKQINRFQKYGPDVDESTKAAENYTNTQQDMELAMKSVSTIIGTQLIPHVNSIMKRTSEWIAENKALIKTKAEEWVEKLKDFLKAASVVAKSMFSTFSTGTMVMWSVVSTILAVIEPLLKMIGLLGDSEDKSKDWQSRLELLGQVLGFAALGILAMNVAAKAAAVVQGVMAAATATVTAAQWAWNAAMTANPIGLIIAGVAALIALIAAVVVKWEEWGAAVALFMGPLGLVISLIQSFRRNWDMVKEAFSEGGIIEGLKAIGAVILDALLMPIQQLLELASRLPGVGDLAAGAAESIEKLRRNMGVTTQAQQEEQRAAAQQTFVQQNVPMQASTQAIDPLEKQNQGLMQMNKEMRAQLNIDVNDPGNQTTVTEKESKNMKPKIRTNSTLAAHDRRR